MISVDSIKAAVAGHYSVPVIALSAANRSGQMTRSRWVAMYLCSRLTNHSIAAIGRAFCRDHTSVLHAINQIKALAEGGDSITLTLDTLTKIIVEGHPVSLSAADQAANYASMLAAALHRTAARNPAKFLELIDPLLAVAMGLEKSITEMVPPGQHRKRQKVWRHCMCCRKPFVSQGAHHRLCGVCRAKSEVEVA